MTSKPNEQARKSYTSAAGASTASLRAAAAGWRVEEVGVDYLPRTRRSKVTGTVRGRLRAVGDMRAVLAEVPGTRS
jgi:hypothetical protein